MSIVLSIIIYTVLVFATSTIGAMTGIGGGVIRKPLMDAMGDFNASQIAFLNVVTVLAMSLVSILRQSKNFNLLPQKGGRGCTKKGLTSGATPPSSGTGSATESATNGANCSATAANCGCQCSPQIAQNMAEVPSDCCQCSPQKAQNVAEVPSGCYQSSPQIAQNVEESEPGFGLSKQNASQNSNTTFAQTAQSTKNNTAVASALSLKNLIFLSIGSVIGGVGGEVIFAALVRSSPDQLVKLAQNSILLVVLVLVLAYMLFKNKISTLTLRLPIWFVLAGLILGILASFLGIGGGPMNLAILMLMFSMSLKEAAFSSLAIIMVSQLSKLLISIFSGTILVITAPMVYLSVGFLALGAVVGGFVGSALSKKFSDKIITVCFNVLQLVLIAITIYNIVQNSAIL